MDTERAKQLLTELAGMSEESTTFLNSVADEIMMETGGDYGFVMFINPDGFNRFQKAGQISRLVALGFIDVDDDGKVKMTRAGVHEIGRNMDDFTYNINY